MDQPWESEAAYLEAQYQILRCEATEGLRYSVRGYARARSRDVFDDEHTFVYPEVPTYSPLRSFTCSPTNPSRSALFHICSPNLGRSRASNSPQRDPDTRSTGSSPNALCQGSLSPSRPGVMAFEDIAYLPQWHSARTSAGWTKIPHRSILCLPVWTTRCLTLLWS